MSYVQEAIRGQSSIENMAFSGRPRVPTMVIARVVGVHEETATVDCWGLNEQQGIIWPNVSVINTVYSEKEGSVWLPTIDPIQETTDYLVGQPNSERNVFALLCFISENATLPVCIGFISPGQNEVSFAEPGTRIDRHASNVYERLTKTGTYELVFPDNTYFKITDFADSDIPTTVAGLNYHTLTNPWEIIPDNDRKIILSHSAGNRLSINKTGVSLISSSEGTNDFSTSLFDSNGLNLSGANANLYINGTSFSDLNQLQINNSISSVFNNGELPSLSGTTGSPVPISLSPNVFGDGSISLAKLDTVVATYAQLLVSSAQIYTTINTLDAQVASNLLTAKNLLQQNINTVSSSLSTHVSDTAIHLQLGTSHTTAAYGDHTHDALNTSGAVTYASTVLSVSSTSSSAGTANNVARGDHSHGLDITSLSASPTSITIGATTSVGSSTTAFARADHIHGTPSTWTATTHNHTTLTNSSNSLALNSNGTVALTGSSIDLVGTVFVNGVSLTNVIRGTQTQENYLLYATTTDSTTRTYLTTAGGVTSTSNLSGTNHIVISQNQVWSFSAEIVANASMGTKGGKWVVTGVIRKQSLNSSTTFIGTPMASAVFVDPEFANTSVYVETETNVFGSLMISVVGIAGTSVTWSAIVTIKGSYNNATSTAFSSNPIGDTTTTGSVTSFDYSTYFLKYTTMGTESAIMTMNGFAPSLSNIPILANNSAWFVKINIAANASGSSAGAWIISGIFRRSSGASTTAFVGPIVYEQLCDTSLATANVNVDANTILGGIGITISGISSVSVNWLAIIEATEVG